MSPISSRSFIYNATYHDGRKVESVLATSTLTIDDDDAHNSHFSSVYYDLTLGKPKKDQKATVSGSWPSPALGPAPGLSPKANSDGVAFTHKYESICYYRQIRHSTSQALGEEQI